ncbi:hypothetical protein CHUAL_008236 [Chamberlinius hualienensis]
MTFKWKKYWGFWVFFAILYVVSCNAQRDVGEKGVDQILNLRADRLPRIKRGCCNCNTQKWCSAVGPCCSILDD